MGNTLNEQKRRDRKTASDWRRRADSNRWCSFCRAVPYHLATSPYLRIKKMERETGIEPATFSLARRCSTTEPLPQTLAFARLRYHTRRELSTAFFPVEIKAFESFQAWRPQGSPLPY